MREKSCVSCHQDILGGKLDGKYQGKAMARWKKNIHSLTAVPGLVGLEKRFRRDWVADFLLRPHSIRPGLPASMPRLKITREEADAIAMLLVPTEDNTPVTLGSAEEGRKAFTRYGCASCHQFSGLTKPIDPQPMEPQAKDPRSKSASYTVEAVRLAPDLRFTRERMSSAAVLRWLKNPQEINPGTMMPVFALSAAERADLAAFILRESIEPIQRTPFRFSHVPVTRKVSYKEVSEKVFRKVCWHCHSDPKPARGDGGPGNTGGFGYEGAGLDLGSYEAILRGKRLADGTYQSVIAKDDSGLPLIIRHMLARHEEVAAEYRAKSADTAREEILGMPLGLPPIASEDIGLVLDWIEQGVPRGE